MVKYNFSTIKNMIKIKLNPVIFMMAQPNIQYNNTSIDCIYWDSQDIQTIIENIENRIYDLTVLEAYFNQLMVAIFQLYIPTINPWVRKWFHPQ